MQMPLGGAGAVQIMEQMIAGASEKFIAVGCCCALEDGAEGDLYIPTAALRQEGTSQRIFDWRIIYELLAG